MDFSLIFHTYLEFNQALVEAKFNGNHSISINIICVRVMRHCLSPDSYMISVTNRLLLFKGLATRIDRLAFGLSGLSLALFRHRWRRWHR